MSKYISFFYLFLLFFITITNAQEVMVSRHGKQTVVNTLATTVAPGQIQLAGDLSGTATAPTVPELALKAPLASPALTGMPTAPTASAGTNTTQIATTEFVAAAVTAIPSIYSANGTITGGNRTVAQGTNNLAFTSTATTGTSHFTVDGTTFNVNANLNRVGIGSATPTDTFQVAGGITTSGGTVGNKTSSATFDYVGGARLFAWGNGTAGTGNISFFNTDTANGSSAQRMTIADTGNVGIGELSPASRLSVVSPTSVANVATSNSTESIVRLTRNGNVNIKWPSTADIQIGSYEASQFSRTKLSFLLNDGGTVTPNVNVLTLQANGRVGIGTETPITTLDVVGSPTTAGVADGIIAPRLTRSQLISKTSYNASQTGAIVYITDLSGTLNTATANVTAVGYYFFDGSVWNSMKSTVNVFAFGDVKTGMQANDHNGWVKLDGRLRSTLTATQQVRAVTLGIAANLPDATNTVLMQNSTTLGSVSGSMVKTIAQNQLPNVSPTVTINNTTSNMISAGDHQHFTVASTSTTNFASDRINDFTFSLADTANQGNNPFSADLGYVKTVADQAATSSNGIHTHTMNPHDHTATVSSINGGVSQQTFDVTPRALSINTFVYLGD